MNSLLKIAIASSLAAAANAQAFNWTQDFPLTSPSTRERTYTGTDGLAYYVYGGQSGSVTTGRDDLWSYDGTDWTLLTASGASCGERRGGAAAFDIARGKFVVFGGNTPSGVANDTWEWDSVNGWVQVFPATSPSARWLINHGVYVPGLGLVFHGGSTGNTETWAFPGGDWVQLSNTGPATQNSSLTYREVEGDLILHGGNPGGAANSDTWRFDLVTGTWSQIITATLPETGAVNDFGVSITGPLFGHSSYYNPLTGYVIVHGGGGQQGGDKTWQFDGTNWSEVTTNGPRHRNGGMHWVAVLNKAVYGPCNENNGARNNTRTHGPAVDASVVSYGATCGGLSLAPDNAPWAGTTFSATCTGMDPSNLIKLSIWGFSSTNVPIGLLGILGSIPGCELHNTAETILIDVAASGSNTSLFPLPPSPAIAGTEVHLQAGDINLSLNNLRTSNGLTLTIGG